MGEWRGEKAVSFDKITWAASGEDSSTLGEGDSGAAESWRDALIGRLGANLGRWMRRPRWDVELGRNGERRCNWGFCRADALLW